MRKFSKVFIVLSVLVIFGLMSQVIAKKDNCVAIKDGILTYSAGHYLAGQPLVLGFDDYGYNYQAHLFNGFYGNAYFGRYGFPPYLGNDEEYLAENPGAEGSWIWVYRKPILNMKWNEAWLSNKDCDGDGLLDRHSGFDTYIGSGAWLTNHEIGTYVGDNGEECHYTYFVKIVAAPADATINGGIWYRPDGSEIGPVIWGQFAIIQEVWNDPCAGAHGVQYKSPVGPGFGKY